MNLHSPWSLLKRLFGFKPTSSGHRKGIEEHSVGTIQFLGEQNGPSEWELKRCLTELFESEKDVKSAYLVRTQYDKQLDSHVTLCLRTISEPDKKLVGLIGKSFAGIFAAHVHLDIIFLDDAREREVAAVCMSFFRRS